MRPSLNFAAALAIACAAGTARADVITDWQSTYQDIIRATGGAPCPVSRAGPMLSLAMFDAVNGIDRVIDFNSSFQPYQSGIPAPAANSSREAAAAAAAFYTLAPLHSGNQPALDLITARFNDQMAAIPDGPGKINGLNYGQSVANSLMAIRATDGFDADPSYTPGGHYGDWSNTPDGPNVPAFSPHWGNVTPWGLQSGAQFRPTRLTDYGGMESLIHHPDYAEQINGSASVLGVKELGSRNSMTRTAEETEIAWFWANDRDGTSKPPGQLVEISKVVSNQEGLSMSQNARMFALINMAMGDACIASWDSKYNTDIDLWRPISAIREELDDGNDLTTPDPNWLPLNDFTPPFPAYTSGHATMGAAHAGIMAALFGDEYTFTIGSEEFGVNPGLGYPADLTRTFDRFSDAAWENAISRIYLGVHFEWDAIDGNILGYDVAQYIFDNYLQPVPAPGALALFAAMPIVMLKRRRS